MPVQCRKEGWGKEERMGWLGQERSDESPSFSSLSHMVEKSTLSDLSCMGVR